MLTLGQAAKEAGKTKTAIANAIKIGRLSATRDGQGRYQIDPAELFRVYPRVSLDLGDTRPPEDAALRREIDLLREQVAREQEINRLLFSRLDEEAAERRKLTMLLTHQPDSAPEVVADAERAGFRLPPWAWLFVGAGLVAVTGAAFAWRHPEFFA